MIDGQKKLNDLKYKYQIKDNNNRSNLRSIERYQD